MHHRTTGWAGQAISEWRCCRGLAGCDSRAQRRPAARRVADFTGCVDGHLSSWVAPIDVAEGEGGAFYAYDAKPVEEFWILDVDGTRLVIEATWSIDAPAVAIAEMRAVLDSIRLEP